MVKKEDSLNLKIAILPSNKIRYAYLQGNYFAPNVGNLGVSCMRHKEMQKALNFYVKNNVRIVVVIDDNNKIHARALLWDNVRSTKLKNPFTYLDRIYARSDELLSLFYDLATTNKWKRYHSTSVSNMDKNYYKENIDAIGMCHLPFNDTFRYLHLKKNLLTSSTKESTVELLNLFDSPVILNVHNNQAYYPQLDPDRVQEAISGSYISKKDAVKVKRYDGYVLKINIADIDGDYYSIFDDLIVKATNDKYILKENSVTEIFTNDIIDKSKAIQSPKYKGYIHKSNIVHINDEIYHKQDADIICFDNKWYHISQCFINFNRKEVNIEMSKPVLTPKGNKEFVKQITLFNSSLTEKFMSNSMFLRQFTYEKGPSITRDGSLIPKEKAIRVYDLAYSPMLNKLLYQEKYFTKRTGLIKLTTGEFIVDTENNRNYLKKFNNKYYIKQDFEAPNKNQLRFDFGDVK